MSKKSEKNHRQKNLNVDIVDENTTYVSQDKIFDYLANIMRRFSGYNFISVSKPALNQDNKFYVFVMVHKNIPIQDEQGKYQSDQDQYVRNLFVEDGDFPGMIMDRQKHYTFGNPFKRKAPDTKDEQVPDLGKEKVEFKPEDESIQPL